MHFAAMVVTKLLELLFGRLDGQLHLLRVPPEGDYVLHIKQRRKLLRGELCGHHCRVNCEESVGGRRE